MNRELEKQIYDMLDTIGEAVEHLKETENPVLCSEVAQGREYVELLIGNDLNCSLSYRIDTASMEDTDWLLNMYRVMEEVTRPLEINNKYDKEFLELLEYIWTHSREQLLAHMKHSLGILRRKSGRNYDAFVRYFERFPLWGTLNPDNGDYQTFELRVNVLKQRSYEFLHLYKKLEDYLSKRTLCAILRNWTFLDFNYLAEVKSIFPDYYEPDIFSGNENDVFVDIGAFTGDSILQYIQMYGTKYKRIYAYEISEDTVLDLCKNVAEYHDIIVRCKGVGDKKGSMYIEKNGDSSANKLVAQEDEGGGGRGTVEIVALDEDIEDEISFIKMDIEGAEQSALLGAVKTIQRYHPKLAICTYHGYEDIWKIPFIIESIYPGYTFYLRHYGGNLIPTEFVLLCREK